MHDLKQIRFVSANFLFLQGLRMIPLGLMLLFVTLWENANGGKGGARSVDWAVVLIGLAVFFTLYFLIDHYYSRTFGKVRPTPESARLVYVFSLIGLVLAAGAAYLDMYSNLPFSAIGLVLAAGLIADFVRVNWPVKGRFLVYYPLSAVIIVLVSILPLLGVDHWWKFFGLKNQLFGITAMIGVFGILGGFCGHIFLVRTLSPKGHQHADAI